MTQQTIAQLKAGFTDKSVEADRNVPELARFAGKTGKVITVNENKKVIVDFDDGAWYDIPPEYLRITAEK
jgi:hypothetical protein